MRNRRPPSRRIRRALTVKHPKWIRAGALATAALGIAALVSAAPLKSDFLKLPEPKRIIRPGLWIPSAPAIVRAQNLDLIGASFPFPFVPPSSSLAPVAITGTDNTFGTTSSSVATFATRAIGPAASDRRVAVCISFRLDANISSVTIGGISATQAVVLRRTSPSPDIIAAIWWASVPTGTTATIVVTLSASDGAVGISVFSVTGGAGTVPDTDSAEAASASVSISALTIGAGQGAIGLTVNGADTSAVGWTNMTEYSDFDDTDNRHSAAQTTTAGTPTISVTGGSTGHGVLVGATFG